MIIHDIIVFSSYHLRKSSGKEPRLMSALALSLILALTLNWNPLVSIASFSPSSSISINTGNKIQMDSGPIEKRQC